ncbi:MAG: hypothetical protein WBG19_02765 [Thermoplasmata archaeon]
MAELIVPGPYTITAIGNVVGGAGDTATTLFVLTEPTLSLAPNAGVVGDSVTVSGYNFSVTDTSVTITGDVLGTIHCPVSDGVISTGCRFVVASVENGSYEITAKGNVVGGPGDTTSTSFFVREPTITLFPAEGVVGDIVTISGSGFSAADSSLGVSGAIVQDLVPCELLDGKVTGGCTFEVGSAPHFGPYTITAVGSVVGGEGDTARTNFTLGAGNVSLSPTSGPVNSSITISANGLIPSTSYTLNFTSTATFLVYTERTFTTDVNGNFTGKFPLTGVPLQPTDVRYIVGVYGSQGFVASAGIFTVTSPNVTITPTSGPVGTGVTLQATGLRPTSLYPVAFDTTKGVVDFSFVWALPTDAHGNYSGTMNVPSDIPAGTYYVDLQFSNGTYLVTASEQFTVTTAYAEIYPSSGPSGTDVYLLASGLLPNTMYSVEVDPVRGVESASYGFTLFMSDPNGSYEGNFTAPFGDPAGKYFVDLFDAADNFSYAATATNQFTLTAPSLEISLDSGLPSLSGPPNTMVFLRATGLVPRTEYALELDTAPGVWYSSGPVVDRLTSDINGSFFGTFNVSSNTSEGTYYVDLFDSAANNSYAANATTPFEVTTPIGMISPTSGPNDTIVNLSVTGLAPGVGYVVYLDFTQGDGYHGLYATEFTADDNGSVSGLAFFGPDAPGSYYVDIFEGDSAGYILTAGQFTDSA